MNKRDELHVIAYANKYFADRNDLNNLSDENFDLAFSGCVNKLDKNLYDALRHEILCRVEKMNPDKQMKLPFGLNNA